MGVFIIELIINIYNFIKKKKTDFSAWLIKLGILLTIWGNLLIISMNYFEVNATFFKEYYAPGAFPLWQIFVSLTLCTFVNWTKNAYGIYKEKCSINKEDALIEQ